MYCVKTTETIIMRPSRDCSPAILDFPNQRRDPPLSEGASNRRGVGKSCTIRPRGDVVGQSRCSNVTLSSINSARRYYGPVIAQFIYSVGRFVSDSWASCFRFRDRQVRRTYKPKKITQRLPYNQTRTTLVCWLLCCSEFWPHDLDARRGHRYYESAPVCQLLSWVSRLSYWKFIARTRHAYLFAARRICVGAAFAMATCAVAVCLSRWCIVPLWLSLSSCDLHQIVAQPF